MKDKKLSLTLMVLVFFLPSILYASEQARDVEQKLIVLFEDHSSFLRGDPDWKATDKQVLPRLLNEGWVIKQLSSGDEKSGYVLIEKKLSALEKAQRAQQSAQKETSFVIAVSKGGDITLAGQPTNTHLLLSKLKDLGATSKTPIRLEVNPHCPYKIVMAIMNTLQGGDFSKLSFGDQK